MLDSTDKKILSMLSLDSRQPMAKVAEAVNLSTPAVHARVKKLEEHGVISGYSLNLNPRKLDRAISAFIRISIGKASCSSIADHLLEIPEVEECHSVAGEECLLVKVRAKNTEVLNQVILRTRQIENVTKTISMVVLKTEFERPTQILKETELP